MEVEVIDPRTLVPFRSDTIINSVKKTGRILITDEGYERCNIAAEIVSDIYARSFLLLDVPPERLCLPMFLYLSVQL
jgi:pyruvate dehydrogenase E1 component beta subunit